MFNQLLFWGSNIVGAIEGKIEDMVITEGIIIIRLFKSILVIIILGIFTFSLGAMYLTAGYLQDTNFFFTSFFAFNLSMILLHSMLIYTGRNKVTDNIWNIIELFVVLIIFIYLKMNENKTSKTKTSTVDPKESKKEK
jgi:uncharacterized membrane protein